MTVEEIKRLPTEEKFRLMEALWQDLKDRYEEAPVPETLAELLEERKRRVAAGEAKMLDWDTVKSVIGRG